MTITAQEIITDVGVFLHDTDGVRWTTSDILGYINDGERAVTILKPNAYVVRTSFKLAEGVRQNIPSGGIKFLGTAPRNMGVLGVDPGQFIQMIDESDLIVYNPGFPEDTADATVTAIIYNQEDPKSFICYPPQPDTIQGYIQWPYSANPPEITGAASNINLDDVYKEPLIQWCLYRAYSRDNEDASNDRLAQGAKNDFYTLLGIKKQNEAIEEPK